MLYLAQVCKNINSGALSLQLFAHQQEDHLWELNHFELIDLTNFPYHGSLTEGLLLLVELDQNRQVVSFKSANKWVFELVEKHLTSPIFNEDFVKQELEKVENWRREMALQSQDLTRRNLELETRQEQLQELEEKLKQRQKELEENTNNTPNN